MKVLVAVASKHGSTYEIAEAIANEFEAAGLTADLREIGLDLDLSGYDAAVIGSAVYMGRWLSEAQKFLEANQEQLVEIPVWLFSSGPLGKDSAEEEGEPYNLQEIMVSTQARGHKVFIGKLDKNELSIGEKLAVRMVKAPTGDFRDWQAIKDWTGELVKALSPSPFPV